jgi:hypothetical protein
MAPHREPTVSLGDAQSLFLRSETTLNFNGMTHEHVGKHALQILVANQPAC